MINNFDIFKLVITVCFYFCLVCDIFKVVPHNRFAFEVSNRLSARGKTRNWN